MCNNSLYSRFEGTYRNLCDSIDRLDDFNYPYKEIARGDLGSDLAYLRELINEVHSLEKKYENGKLVKENPKAIDVSEEQMFKCTYLRGGKLGCKNHTNHIRILVKFLRTNEEFMSEQFFDYLTFAVRCMDFAQYWENEFQEMPWIYYGMENLLCARDHIYSFYSDMKYEITDDLKHTLIDAIECVEWFGVNLKGIPRNGRYKDFHEYDKVVLKRNSEYIRHLHLKFLQKDKRAVKREEERLIRKAEENRKHSHPSDAILKPVYSDEKPKVKHYNDFGEYLDDHPEIVKMADKYPTMFQERVYEYHMPLKEKLMWIALYTVGIVSAWFVGGVLGSLIKGML